MRVDPNFIRNLASSLNQTQVTQQQLTAQLSSGARITSLSQDPVSAGENVLLLNQIQQDDSFTRSSSMITGQLQVADSALGSVVAQLTQAISLATSANNGTMNASNVRSIASQISGILGEVTTLANTSYQGQYIFAGGQTSTSPFTTSTATSPAVTTYRGDSNINYLQMPNGEKIQLNVPGDQIFSGAGSNSVFAALNALIADYSSGTVDTAKAVTDTAALNTSLNYVSQQRVTIDNSITHLTAASDAVNNEQMQLTAAQTNLMQADIAQVATQLSLATRSRPHLSQSLHSWARPRIVCSASSDRPRAITLPGLPGVLKPAHGTFSISCERIAPSTVYTQTKRTRLAGSSPIYLECNSRPSVRSVAKRISPLASRDLLRSARGDTDHQKHHGLCLGLALGASEFSCLDRPARARDSQERMNSFVTDQSNQPALLMIFRFLSSLVD